MSLYELGICLDAVIDEAINAFADERRAYWAEDDEGRHCSRTAEALATILLELSEDLTSSRGKGQWESGAARRSGDLPQRLTQALASNEHRKSGERRGKGIVLLRHTIDGTLK